MLTQSNIVGLVFTLVIFFTIVLMQWNKKLPTIDSLNRLTSVLNARGGNILVLLILVVFFYASAMKFFYWTIERIMEGKLTADNALVATGVTFVTGTAFGMVLSPMLKAMTGESSTSRTSDILPSGGSVTTNTTTEVHTDEVKAEAK